MRGQGVYGAGLIDLRGKWAMHEATLMGSSKTGDCDSRPGGIALLIDIKNYYTMIVPSL